MPRRDEPRRDSSDVIAELVAEHVELDRDVVELDERTWAIHGSIAYEGQIVAAIYPTEEDARADLVHLDEIERDQLDGRT